MVAAVRVANTRLISDRSWLLLLTIGSLLVRLPLAGKGFWGDEASTYFDIVSADPAVMFDRLYISELTPPLYFLGMYVWAHRFGSSEWVLQLPSLAFGVAVVPVTYAIGRAIGTSRTGVIAALLTLSSYELLLFSVEARAYALATLLCAGATLLFCRYLQHRRLGAFAGSIGLMILFIYTHYDGFVFVGAIGFAFVCLHRMAKLSLRLGALGFSAIVLATFPLWALLRFQAHYGQPWNDLSLIERPMLLKYIAALVLPIPSGPAFALGWFISTVFLLALAVRLWRAQQRLRSSYESVVRATATTDLFVGLMLVAIIATMAMLALLQPRYTVPFLPLSFVYCTRWIESLSLGALSYRSYTVALAIAVVNMGASYREFTVAKSGVRALVHDVGRRASAHAVYLVVPDASASTLGYYADALHTPIHGFATWDHPEIFDLPQYEKRWRNPRAIDEAAQRVAALARSGSTELDVVRMGEPGRRILDAGRMPFSRADDLIAALRRQYRIRYTADYAGSTESATLIVFDLRAPPSGVTVSDGPGPQSARGPNGR